MGLSPKACTPVSQRCLCSAQGRVEDIATDASGRRWLATHGAGLAAFDGTGAPSNSACVVQDDGSIWAFGGTKGNWVLEEGHASDIQVRANSGPVVFPGWI